MCLSLSLSVWGQAAVAVLGLSVWGGAVRGHGFGLEGIYSEQLQVSYYELYYASLCFWCLGSHSSKNTQNMHAEKSTVYEFWSDRSNISVKLHTIYIKHHSHMHITSYYYITWVIINFIWGRWWATGGQTFHRGAVMAPWPTLEPSLESWDATDEKLT